VTRRVFLVLLALVLALSVGLVACGTVGEEEEEEEETYDLTIESSAGGSVVTPGEGTRTYAAGKVVDLVGEAEEGYRFIHWSGDVDTIDDVNDATTTVTMHASYSIEAKFEATAATQYTLTISSTGGGSVTDPGEPGPYTFDEGDEVNLVATPDACHRFGKWTGDVDDVADVNSASTTITINDDCSIAANFEEEEVTFPDPGVNAAVRQTINKDTGSIYPADLEGLTSLECWECYITDLRGLECATSLTWLYLSDNQIIDISPLANLTNLDKLFLGRNQIINISPLVDLTSLTWLYLPDNQIINISPVANLSSLTRFDLHSNQISDISPLANLTNLTVIYAYSNQITDISPVTNLTNLTYLDLRFNQITDISPLVDNEGLSGGDEVCLSGNPLNSDSINIYIPQLEARGVIVDY